MVGSMSDFSSPKGSVKRFAMPLWAKILIALAVIAGLLGGWYLYQQANPGPTCACTGPVQKPVASSVFPDSALFESFSSAGLAFSGINR